MRTQIVSIYKDLMNPSTPKSWIESVDIPPECKECIVRQISFIGDPTKDQETIYQIYSSLGIIGCFALDTIAHSNIVNITPQTVIFLKDGQTRQITFEIRDNGRVQAAIPAGVLSIILEFK